MTTCPFIVRLMAIMQLCLVFVMICWYGSLPFSGQLFESKSRHLLFQTVMGKGEQAERVANERQKETLLRNSKRFAALPRERRLAIENGYKQIQEAAETPFYQKLVHSIVILTVGIPAYTLAWMVFSLTVSLMLLLGKPYAREVVWILPLIALFYSADNLYFGQPAEISAEAALFPSESQLISGYTKTPLSGGIEEQRLQLKEAWGLYLADIWASRSPLYQIGADLQEEGEFAFHLARAEAAGKRGPLLLRNRREPEALLMLYLLWNTLFALIAYRSTVTLHPNQVIPLPRELEVTF